ncbi:acyl-CoA desaturase [uncultured Sphingomonas sp.]|uniref:acyl-CoA desaturase n=1 Tax=uncultured Sphingomonas sp. TaxID=158754 RepID=UPI0035CBE2CD
MDMNFQTTGDEMVPGTQALGFDPSVQPKRGVIESPYIYRQQRRHFLLLDVLPNVAAAIAVVLAFFRPVGWPEISVLVVMWAVTGLGITAGYHRHFTHLAFKATPAVQVGLAIAGAMAGQGGVISWVAIHRRHHQYSDQEGDPHSPNLAARGWRGQLRGLTHSHFTWMARHAYPNPAHYAKDLLRNAPVCWVNRHYYRWVVLGIVAPAVAVALIERSPWGLLTGALWGGGLRIALLGHTIWAINSVLHTVGQRPHETDDNSHNSAVFGLLTFGESFHNNHHAYPRSASFGLHRAWLDPGYWLIRLLAAGGLAWDVWTPPRNEGTTSRRTEKL